MQYIRLFTLIKQSRAGRLSLAYLYIFLFIGITADFVANERPIYAVLEGKVYFPIFRQYGAWMGLHSEEGRFVLEGWKDQSFDRVVFPLIPYAPETIDRKNLGAKSPFGPQRVEDLRYWHWLGTDTAGHDVAAGLIHGTRVAMLVGLIGMLTATILGILLGGIAGYFGDTDFQSTRAQYVFAMLAVVGSIYVLWAHQFGIAGTSGTWQRFVAPLGMLCVIWIVCYVLAKLFNKLPGFGKLYRVPIDFWVTRITEVLNAVPTLLFIMAILATLDQPSIYYIMLVIGLLRWTGIARLVRAELLRVKSMQYIEAARALGFQSWRILFRHALPNSLEPVWVAVAFGMAGAVLVEASLSFLGIGLPVESVTWGSLMRQLPAANLRPWWLAVFPGLAIFFTVLAFNTLGEALSAAFDPRKQATS